MPAKDLGVKHTCWKCGTKFYDLKKPDPACPKCGTDPRQAPVTKGTPPAERRRTVKEEPLEEVAETVEEADVDEDLDDEADEPEEAADEDT
jgi:uncharacterized protein (TIGR02300 family)